LELAGVIVQERAHHLRVTEGTPGDALPTRPPAQLGVERRRSSGGTAVRTLMIFHEVDDVDHWLTSPKRREVFGPLGITARTFVDPTTSNRVGLILEVASMELFQEAMGSPAAAAAMTYDGVRPDTMEVFIER
jgi:hypothetical protein